MLHVTIVADMGQEYAYVSFLYLRFAILSSIGLIEEVVRKKFLSAFGIHYPDRKDI